MTGYYWVDGTPFNYFDWEDGQPDNHHNREECGAFELDDYKMKDFVCGDYLPFICEIPKGSFSTK